MSRRVNGFDATRRSVLQQQPNVRDSFVAAQGGTVCTCQHKPTVNTATAFTFQAAKTDEKRYLGDKNCLSRLFPVPNEPCGFCGR